MTKPVPQAVFQPAEVHRSSCSGPSLLELMWAALVEELGQLMPGGEYHEDELPANHADDAEWAQFDVSAWDKERARIQGACQGISACIALVLNPYYPDVEAVKAEAVTRWTAQEAAAGAGDGSDGNEES